MEVEGQGRAEHLAPLDVPVDPQALQCYMHPAQQCGLHIICNVYGGTSCQEWRHLSGTKYAGCSLLPAQARLFSKLPAASLWKLPREPKKSVQALSRHIYPMQTARQPSPLNLTLLSSRCISCRHEAVGEAQCSQAQTARGRLGESDL